MKLTDGLPHIIHIDDIAVFGYAANIKRCITDNRAFLRILFHPDRVNAVYCLYISQMPDSIPSEECYILSGWGETEDDAKSALHQSLQERIGGLTLESQRLLARKDNHDLPSDPPSTEGGEG